MTLSSTLLKAIRGATIQGVTHVSAQVYVQYMKFSRRTEGIKAARNVFKLAREDTRCGHQVYVAAALMEYNISKVDFV